MVQRATPYCSHPSSQDLSSSIREGGAKASSRQREATSSQRRPLVGNGGNDWRRTAPHGFLIYFKNVHGVMANAGHNAECVAYLMGNHVIAEKMFRATLGQCSTSLCGR